MSKEAKAELLSSNNNKLKDDVEMVFGTPEFPKSDLKPSVHHVNEKRQGNGSPQNRRNQGETDEPLLNKPPLAEVESLESDDKPKDATLFSGSDEGGHGHNNLGRPIDGDADLHPDDEKALDINGDGDGNWHGHDETDFYYGDGYIANGITTRAGEDRPGSPVFSIIPQTIPDVNTYQQKKNLAQGMMDLALLSANANQLRYVLESRVSHPYYYPSLVFITCSIILQVAVGVGLIMNSRYNVKDEKDICKADKINNMTILGIFLITIVNVFIASFSVADRSGSVLDQASQINSG